MNTTCCRFVCFLGAFLLASFFALNSGAEPPKEEAAKPEPLKEPPLQEGWKRVPVSPNVWLEVNEKENKKRRVLVLSSVCLREGQFGLECLLCKKGTKEHESILATSADARAIHTALETAGLKAGKPVEYQPKFVAPSGAPVKISLQYEKKKGEFVTVSAQQWVKNVKTKKDLEHDWVFAGSKFYDNPEGKDKPPVYAANVDGGLICISNVLSAMLDLPIDSPKAIENRVYEPHTQNIPPLDTSVVIIFEPK